MTVSPHRPDARGITATYRQHYTDAQVADLARRSLLNNPAPRHIADWPITEVLALDDRYITRCGEVVEAWVGSWDDAPITAINAAALREFPSALEAEPLCAACLRAFVRDPFAGEATPSTPSTSSPAGEANPESSS